MKSVDDVIDQLESADKLSADLDGDGRVSNAEINLCKLCIGAAIIIAFGDKAIQFI